MKLKHLIKSQQLDQKLLYSLFKDADEIRSNLKKHNKDLKGKILTTLFYEPSTRTRLSFESAMLKLGGNVISTENAREFSSAIKGESIIDTIRIVSEYSDCIVIRHYQEGTAEKASKVSNIPIINAGDGQGQHPTQALLDLYTIFRELGRLDNLKIVIIGDLKHGRTARSLCYLLGKFKDIDITFVSPENIKMKNDIKVYLTRHKVTFREESNLNKNLPKADVIYMTRIQRERMSKEDYKISNGEFIINKESFKLVKPSSIIMHPLPHVEEIVLPLNIEQKDKRVAYFRQSANGLYIRMALLNHLLS